MMPPAGRSFYLTANGYKVATINDTNPEDEICIFAGNNVLFVTRATWATEEGRYLPIGECYIYGLREKLLLNAVYNTPIESLILI